MSAFTRKAPVDLDGMAQAFGVQVLFDDDMPSDISGKIERLGKSFQITINGRHAPRRRRFTLAHELAHFILHRDLIESGVVDNAMYRSATLSDDIERQANRFAADLLMPAALVQAAWRDGVRSYVEMASRFDVSEEAARIRMRDLRLGG
jgi:Zn-dependent peptidase ImmA (M78 family)